MPAFCRLTATSPVDIVYLARYRADLYSQLMQGDIMDEESGVDAVNRWLDAIDELAVIMKEHDITRRPSRQRLR